MRRRCSALCDMAIILFEELSHPFLGLFHFATKPRLIIHTFESQKSFSVNPFRIRLMPSTRFVTKPSQIRRRSVPVRHDLQ